MALTRAPPCDRRCAGPCFFRLRQPLVSADVDHGSARFVGQHFTGEQHHQLIAPEDVALAIDHADTVEKMNAKYGKLYTASKIKAGSYPGTSKDNAVAEVWNLIVTGDKMSNDDAYTIVKTLVEKKADIVKVHKEAESFSLDNQVQDRSPIPFHPGALKYFKEKGVGG